MIFLPLRPMSKNLVYLTFLCTCFLYCKSNPGANPVTEKEPKAINWSKDVPAKHPILNGSAITYKDEIYVLAGLEGRFMKYNPATYIWTDLAGLPGPRSEAAMTLWGDKVVVAGGIDDSAHIMRRVDYYDLVDFVWKELPSLPAPRARFSLTVNEDKLYASCGICGDNTHSFINCQELLFFDDAAKSWKIQNKLTTGRFDHVAISKGDEIYLVGGNGFDPKVGTFYINHAKREFGFKPQMPRPRGNMGGVSIGDFIITFGGKTPGAFSTMEKLDIKNSKWSDFGTCPFWTDRFAFTRWKDRIYVFGGSQANTHVWKGDIVF